MNTAYIYVVGQPDRKSHIVEEIHKAGFKAGILLDSRFKQNDLETYDRIVTVDFEHIDEELERLSTLELSIAGLQCTFENYIVAKAKLGNHFNVPALSIESARLATDKSLMRQAFLQADRSISPDFTTVDTLQEALDFARAHSYPLIIKPTNLVKSLLVLRCNNEEQLIERFTYAADTIGKLYEKYKIYDREPQLIIEEFIEGDQFSIAAFVDEAGTPHFCGGIVSLKNAQEIGVDDNFLYSRILPASLPEATMKQMFSVAEKGVRALKMRSVPAHIELMAGPNGVKIIEIGARIGGYRPRMYSYSYGIDLVAQEINLAIGKLPSLEGTFKTYSGVYELFPEKEGVFESLSGAPSSDVFTYFNVSAKKGAIIGPAKNGYKAAAIIIVTNNNKEQFEALCRQVNGIKVNITV